MTAAPPTTAATGEAIVAHIVATGNDGEVGIVRKATHIGLGSIAVLSTIAQIDVDEPTFLHTFLHGQVKHRLFLPIVNTCDAAIVALSVV